MEATDGGNMLKQESNIKSVESGNMLQPKTRVLVEYSVTLDVVQDEFSFK